MSTQTTESIDLKNIDEVIKRYEKLGKLNQEANEELEKQEIAYRKIQACLLKETSLLDDEESVYKTLLLKTQTLKNEATRISLLASREFNKVLKLKKDEIEVEAEIKQASDLTKTRQQEINSYKEKLKNYETKLETELKRILDKEKDQQYLDHKLTMDLFKAKKPNFESNNDESFLNGELEKLNDQIAVLNQENDQLKSEVSKEEEEVKRLEGIKRIKEESNVFVVWEKRKEKVVEEINARKKLLEEKQKWADKIKNLEQKLGF